MSNDLGLDRSGNGNNWTPNNLAASDQMLDTPTNNFATWNSVNTTSGCALTQGNLGASIGGSADCTFSTLTMTSGKWYFESVSTSANNFLGSIADPTINSMLTSTGLLNRSSAWAYRSDGNKQTGNVATSWGNTFTTGDIISTAVDMDAEKVWWAKNGVWQQSGDPANGTNEAYSGFSAATNGVAVAHGQFSGTTSQIINFGQDSSFAGNKTAQSNSDSGGVGDFYYTPPSGFLALCTANLPSATVIPSEHFNTVLYTGNGGNKTISGYDFQPDFVWGKARDQAYNHHVHDVVRGVENRLATNTNDAEYGDGALKTFTSDGYTFDTAGSINVNGTSYVNWAWKAGGTAVSNTNGSITSSVSANVDAGFSIVSYTGNGTAGATVGHGLSSAPEMILHKNRDQSWEWRVYHESLASSGDVDYLILNTTVSSRDDSTGAIWHNTETTSSVFYIGSNGQNTNNSGDEMITYCFHSVDGYSKVGSYTGNGSTDGTFVHTGFRPAYVMIKCTSDTTNWHMYDNTRDAYMNPTNEILFPNLSSAEVTGSGSQYDFVSNGFKLRGDSGATNTSSRTYIFLAFAEQPFKHSNAR